MCGQWGRRGVTKKDDARRIDSELPLGDLKAIVDDLSLFRPNITLFGGEPLLHRGCAEIIKYIKQKGMHCLLITNGFFAGDYAADIVDSGLDELNVSLDGSAELHDAIRGMPGVYSRIVTGLKKIRSLKSGTGDGKPLVNLQCTVTEYNYKNLESLLEAAGETCADSLTFHNLIFLSQAALEKQKECDGILGCGSADWEGFAFNPGIDPEILHEKILKILSRRYPFNADFYPNLPRRSLIGYYKDPAFGRRRHPKRCVSPWMAAYIFPDGEIRPCLNLSYSYGNAVKERFTELWNGEKALRFRSFLKTRRAFPVCARCSELYRY